jgi:hypothetical protein
MPRARRWPGPLTRAFLARFFETELVIGSHDVKASFIWLMSGLAAPGFVLPILLLGWDWSTLGKRSGAALLAQIAWPDKLLYLGLSMVATGLVSALVWNSLLIDRRDALVLGTLPVRPRSVVAAKLTSVAIYVLVIAAGMHVLASLTFGVLLSGAGARVGAASVTRGAVAHFAASFLASVFVLVGVTALQALAVLIAGPRRIVRTSAWLQAALVATILVLLASLPGMGHAVANGLGGARGYQEFLQLIVVPGLPAEVQAVTPLAPWLTWMPPVWFLGVYETIRGTDIEAFHAAASTGVRAVGGLLALTLVVLPLAYQRVMRASVEAGDAGGARRPRGRLLDAVARGQSRAPVPRGLAQLLLLTTARVSRHRFLVAAAVGMAAAWTLPLLLASRGAPADQGLTPERVALPFALVTLLVATLRLAAALPSDLHSGWAVSGLGVDDETTRTALRRTLWSVAMAPVVLVSAPLIVVWGGWSTGGGYFVLAVASGAFTIEALLVGYRGLPCAHPWQSEQPLLRRYWPVVAAGLVVPSVLSAWALVHGHSGIVAGLMLVFALLARAASARVPPTPAWDLSQHDPAFRTLGLD